MVQAERADRARAAGDAGTLSDAIAVGQMLVERARTAVEHTRVSHGVDLPAWHGVDLTLHAKAEAEWSRLQERSNRQIVEQLFISGKTASVHVTNLLANLGVHSRLEAAATARRLGLDQPTRDGSAI